MQNCIRYDVLEMSHYLGRQNAVRNSTLDYLREIMKELAKIVEIDEKDVITRTTVFEDTNGALEFATLQKYGPRTKHGGINYRHFREHARKETIEVKAIDAKEQIAGIFTKPLPTPQYQYRRKMLIGW